jgi:hypothetical protein
MSIYFQFPSILNKLQPYSVVELLQYTQLYVYLYCTYKHIHIDANGYIARSMYTYVFPQRQRLREREEKANVLC